MPKVRDQHVPRTRVWHHSTWLTDPERDQDRETFTQQPGRTTLTSLSREVGSCVYFIRCRDGLVKIGTTGDLASRKRAFGAGWEHILAVMPGDREVEQEMHARFASHLRRGREYFDPAPDLLAHINDIRARAGVKPIKNTDNPAPPLV